MEQLGTATRDENVENFSTDVDGLWPKLAALRNREQRRKRLADDVEDVVQVVVENRVNLPPSDDFTDTACDRQLKFEIEML